MPCNFLDPSATETLLKRELASTPDRLQHILVVADRVRQSARDINELHPELYLSERLAYCAALVHDIGYLPEAVETGFHPIDGYRYLVKARMRQLADLIVGHSTAPEEAEILGFQAITCSEHLAAKLITYWDMQVGPTGETLSFAERCADIRHRYGESSPTVVALERAEPRLRQIFQAMDTLLNRHATAAGQFDGQ